MCIRGGFIFYIDFLRKRFEKISSRKRIYFMGGFFMRKSVQEKMIISTLSLGIIFSCSSYNNICFADDIDGNNTGGKVVIDSGIYDNVYGIKIENSEVESDKTYTGGEVTINGGQINGFFVLGIYVDAQTKENVTADGGRVFINGGNFDEDTRIIGAKVDFERSLPEYKTNAQAKNNLVQIENVISQVGSIYGAQSENVFDNEVDIKNSEIILCDSMNQSIIGGESNNDLTLSGVAEYNRVNIDNSKITGNIIGAYSWGNQAKNIGKAENNKVYITNNSIITGDVCGALGYWGTDYNNNSVIIEDSTVEGDVFGANLEKFGSEEYDVNMNNNQIILKGNTDVSEANLYGAYRYESDKQTIMEGNKLVLDNWSGDTKSVNNFDEIDFKNVNWESGSTVLNITEGRENALKDTKINLNSISFNGGSDIKENDSMNFIKGNTNLGTAKDNIILSEDFSAGVATVGSGEVDVNENGDVKYTIKEVKANNQINLVAENRAVAAAFINQGSDLIEQGLDNLVDQYGYGMKTFGAVYGNRSTYDVNSDLKINGWSEIVGIGEKKKFTDSELVYGLFYENGSGNYRTYNEFNNEFFRGDGSLVYNGGGIAGKLVKSNGLYYEGSLRVGTLKSEMTNALRDGQGNYYGYEDDSNYYGAHIGIGRKISIDNDKELDIFGKFFHTHTQGNDFQVAGDKFSFDSIDSDRLRIGAKYNVNKDKKWSTYYGLAYEYEFSGDSEMSVGQFATPTQSLQGGTIMGEIGLSYQADEYSPWSFDLSFTGYQGQRDGFSGNAQIVYNF